MVVEAEYPEGVPLLSAPTPHQGPQIGARYYEALLAEDLTALYLVRRRLGQREGA
jgi:hypothetical protein